MRFPRQEYWSGLPFPSPEDLPNLGIETASWPLCRQILYHWAYFSKWLLNIYVSFKLIKTNISDFYNYKIEVKHIKKYRLLGEKSESPYSYCQETWNTSNSDYPVLFRKWIWWREIKREKKKAWGLLAPLPLKYVFVCKSILFSLVVVLTVR